MSEMAQENASGANSPEEQQVVNQEVQNEKEESEDKSDEMVSKADLKRALDDLHKYKKEALSLKEQLSNKEMEDLKEREEWQKVAQIKEKEALTAKQEAEQLKKSIMWDKKYSALKEKALAAGIRKEALPDLEYFDFDDDVALETTSTGRVNVLGVDQAINKLKTMRPHWFSGRGANINSGNPETVKGGGKVSIKDVFEAEKKAKETGDYAPYKKILMEYQKQN